MKRIKDIIKKGDTIIEVTFAISVFSLVSVIMIQIMDRDLAMIQGTLESEMARNEIDAQAEAIRYIQNSYLSERELAAAEREYMGLWLELSRTNSGTSASTGLANLPTDISAYTSVDCRQYYENDRTQSIHKIFEDKAFVINTRNLNPKDIDNTIVKSRVETSTSSSDRTDIFTESSLYPRVIFSSGTASTLDSDSDALAEIFPDASIATADAQKRPVYDKVSRAEGIWVIAVRDYREKSTTTTPEFFDFHIRTCWSAPGHDRPSTIATTIRLYNPEFIEDQFITNE